jgi:ATP-dependent Zn protease
MDLLTQNREVLDAVANMLIEKEKITGVQML